MRIVERESGDVVRLEELIGREANADRRDRLRIAWLALRGLEKLDIALLLGIAKSTVETWAYAYRDGGIAALAGKKRGGSLAKIRGENAAKLRARIEVGPTAADKVCTLRGKDIQRIACDELGVNISLNTVYGTLHRMGYSCLSPRPRHEKQDVVAQKKFKEETAPFCEHRARRAGTARRTDPRVLHG